MVARPRSARALSSGPTRRARIGAAALGALLLVVAGPECDPPPPPPYVAPDDVRSIEDFLGCLNTALDDVNPSAEQAVQCLPKKCSITLTMSNISAQPACFVPAAGGEGACQMPRVLITCPGPPLFMPSFLLCPTDEGSERVEVGEAVDTAGNMRMADIHINGHAPPYYPADVLSVGDSEGCIANGNTCHDSVGPNQDSAPIDPWGDPQTTNGRPECIIDTDRCEEDKQAIGDESGDQAQCEDRTVTRRTLEEVCDCIENSTDVAALPRGALVTAICNELLAYQQNRGACAMVGCPPSTGPACEDPGEPCDPETGATVTVASGYHCNPGAEEDTFECLSECPCRGHTLEGGGKFLTNTFVSLVRLDLQGTVASQSPGSFTDFHHLEGSLSAFNHETRTLVEATAFSSLDVTTSGADFSATGTGVAVIDSAFVDIEFEASETGGTVEFHVREAGELDDLAGGVGETGRADFELTIDSTP
jgi:hypothetical protein